jgi:hypothetical protein
MTFVLRPSIILEQLSEDGELTLISLLFTGDGFIERFRTPINNKFELVYSDGSENLKS